MSHKSALAVMDSTAEGYNEEVLEWEDSLKEKLNQKPLPVHEEVYAHTCIYIYIYQEYKV